MERHDEAPAREPVHRRTLSYEGFRRADGLWDFEAVLADVKQHDFETLDGVVVAAGEPYHHMLVRVTVDDALTIVDVATTMAVTPFPECQGAREPMRRLVGATLGRGWRRALNEALGGEAGCTHVRELLQNLATAALQTVPAYHQRLRAATDPDWKRKAFPVRPHFVGDCHGWRTDGPVVQRHFPQHAEPADPDPA